MNPSPISKAPANSSPSNLDRMVSLLNSIVSDLSLPNVQPQITEIPERPTSAESGYVSDPEEKQKSGLDQKDFDKPGASAKDTVPEPTEIPGPEIPEASGLEPVATQSSEPQAEKASEKDVQSEVLDSKTPENLDVNVAGKTAVPVAGIKPSVAKSVLDGSTLRKSVPVAVASKGPQQQVGQKSRLVSAKPAANTGVRPKTVHGLSKTLGQAAATATPKIVVKKPEPKPVRPVSASTSKAPFNRSAPLTSSLRAPVKSAAQMLPPKDTKLVRTSSLRATSSTKPVQPPVADRFGLKRSDSVKSQGNASFNVRASQAPPARTGMAMRRSATPATNSTLRVNPVTPTNSAAIRKLGTSSPSLNLQVKKPLSRMGSSNPDLKTETDFKKPAARMNSAPKDGATKMPGKRFGFSNPDLNRQTGARKPVNPLASSSQGLDRDKPVPQTAGAAKKPVKPSSSVTSTGSGIASRLHSSFVKPRGVGEATKKSAFEKK